MKRRKNIIDRDFQLKTAFRVIGIIIIAFILIIAITGIISSDNNRQITAAISDLNRSIKKDKSTIDLILAQAVHEGAAAQGRVNDRIIEDHLETIALMNVNIRQLTRILEQNRIILSVMVCGGVLLGLVLFIYLIRLTNRISGPLYVLSRHMDEIMNGKKPDLRALRKNDELQDFYRQFISFIDSKAGK